MRRLRLAALLVWALQSLGCAGTRGPVELGWRFADGRRCSDAGVSHVTLGGAVSCVCGDAGTACGCKFTCQDGELGESVGAELTGAGEVTALGITPVGGVLYRGLMPGDSTRPSTPVTPLPPRIIDLYFTGGP